MKSIITKNCLFITILRGIRTRPCGKTSCGSIKILKLWWLLLFNLISIELQAQSNISAKSLDSLFIQQLLLFPIEQVSPLHCDSITSNNPIEGACFPLDKMRLTSYFGLRTHPVTNEKNSFHSGIDLRAHRVPVYSALPGFISATGYNPIIGNFIRVSSGNYTLIYGHLSFTIGLKGTPVKAGELIGITGSTGRVTGEHLHFSVSHKSIYINPLLFLNTILNLGPKDLSECLNE